jgi:hypothetical protein
MTSDRGFGDTPESGLYNAHGDYLSAFEQHTGLTMHWLGTPPAFSHCLAHVLRATGSATILEFSSYARLYAAAGLPVYRPAELQPYYPWSLAWRSEEPPQASADLLQIAMQVALRRGWLQPSMDTDAPAWLPPDDPAAEQLAITRSGQSDNRIYLDQQAWR